MRARGSHGNSDGCCVEKRHAHTGADRRRRAGRPRSCRRSRLARHRMHWWWSRATARSRIPAPMPRTRAPWSSSAAGGSRTGCARPARRRTSRTPCSISQRSPASRSRASSGPATAARARTAISPERPQRCNQLWLDPILRERAELSQRDAAAARRFESFEQDDDGVVATVHDLVTRRAAARFRPTISSHAAAAHSSIQKTLGIEMQRHAGARIQSQHLLPHAGAVVASRQGQGGAAFLRRRAGHLAHAGAARRPRAVAARPARQGLFRQCRRGGRLGA